MGVGVGVGVKMGVVSFGTCFVIRHHSSLALASCPPLNRERIHESLHVSSRSYIGGYSD